MKSLKYGSLDVVSSMSRSIPTKALLPKAAEAAFTSLAAFAANNWARPELAKM